ncbi:MAG: chemotaxis protein CheX [Deltaproteobacteria bacterium]|nr:chemotaxis protein CheX [Deltaproteobacteria bacterium]
MEDQLFQVAENTWAITLGLPIVRVSEVRPPETSAQLTLQASVALPGVGGGTLVLSCVPEWAEVAASIMFDLSRAEIDEGLRDDAVGELVNIVGGNLKAILPEEVDLRPPVVTHRSAAAGTERGADAERPPSGSQGAGPATILELSCEGSPVRLAFYE